MFTTRLNINLRLTAIALVLALGTLLLYWPVAHHDFISLDDNLYVTANPQVQAGLTWAGAQWAFTNLAAYNWHPLTWLSHMTDCQGFGLNPAAHHLTNVLFHVANALLLFAWLNLATGATWRSALVAALFAWHPLRVESVAWVAERKDVLSAFFWLLTLIAYGRYAQNPPNAKSGNSKLKTQNSKLFYALALLSCAFAMMSKPMAVTLPFVLLLADVWPLRRIANFQLPISNFKRLVLEKIPFFVLAAATSVINYHAQNGSGATWSPTALPLPVRLANALVSYLRYLSKTFWPADLAVIYPYEKHWPLWLVMAAATLLLLWTGMVILRTRQNPFLFFGWFYFVGTLVPVIGLVQVGPQAMADRYVYLPSIGLFILLVWGAHELLDSPPRRKMIATFAGTFALGACLVVTSRQLAYWKNSVKLFAHAVAVTTDNYVADAYLASALESAGRNDDALPFYFESVRITPHFPFAQWNLGMALLRQNRAAEASEHLVAATKLTPRDPIIRCYAGKALSDAGSCADATAQLTEALRLKPDYAQAQLFLAVNLARQNQTADALPHFAAAAKLEPANPEIHFNYGLALRDGQQPAAAADQFRLALKLTPDFSAAKTALAALLSAHPELK